MTDSVSIGAGYRDQKIEKGSIDDTPIGATTASSGSFTTLTASGATTLNGEVAVGNAVTDKIAFYGKTTIVQPASASQTALAASQTTKTTTQLRSELTAVKTLLARIRKDLKDLGLIKGAA